MLAPGPFFTPTSTPLVSPSSTSELVLLVGSPGSGKSTFSRLYLEPKGYLRVNQDELKTKARCLNAARAEFERELGEDGKGRRVVVDNTNRNVETRKAWLDLAKEVGVPVRCAFPFLIAPALGNLQVQEPERLTLFLSTFLHSSQSLSLPSLAGIGRSGDAQQPVPPVPLVSGHVRSTDRAQLIRQGVRARRSWRRRERGQNNLDGRLEGGREGEGEMGDVDELEL